MALSSRSLLAQECLLWRLPTGYLSALKRVGQTRAQGLVHGALWPPALA